MRYVVRVLGRPMAMIPGMVLAPSKSNPNVRRYQQMLPHQARPRPKGLATMPAESVLYHVTFPENLPSIQMHGLLPSVGGELGPGVYLTAKPTQLVGPKWRDRTVVALAFSTAGMKLLPIRHSANPWLRAYEALFGVEPGRAMYDRAPDHFQWEAIQELGRQQGYDGIRLVDTVGGFNNIVVFNLDKLQVAKHGHMEYRR